MSNESGPVKNLEIIVNPEKWLMATNHFEPFIYPSINEDIIKKEYFEKIELVASEEDLWILRALRDYVMAPIIIDDFPSEKDRNTWQKKNLYLHPEVNSVFEKNKLKVSGVLGVMQIAELDSMLDTDSTQRYEELFKEYVGQDGLSGGYAKMTLKEKIDFIKKITNLSYDLYKSIISKYEVEMVK